MTGVSRAQPSDAPALAAIAAEVTSAGYPDGFALGDTEGTRLVSHRGGALTGAAVVRTNPVHPMRVTGLVWVREDERRQGMGSELAAALLREAVDPLRCRIPSTEAAGLSLAARSGMVLLVRSHAVLVEPAAVVAGQHSEVTMHVPPFTDDVVAAVRSHYRLTHAWDLPSEWTLERTRELLCDDALAAATIAEADEITHVALLHEPGIGELHPAVAICGATRRPDNEQTDFDRTAAAFHAVAARAGHAVLVEADEGNGAALWPVVAGLEHVAVEPPLHILGTPLPALNPG